MVLKYRKHRNRRGQRRMRRTRRKVFTSSMKSSSTPIPDRYFTKLRYTDIHGMSFTGGSGVPATQSYRINSIFDPDLTGTGHQPLGHDEMATLYNRYRVYGMKYRITLSNQSTTDYADICVSLRPNTTTYSSIYTAMESAYNQKSIVGPETGSRNISIIKGYASVAKLRGISKRQLAIEEDYGALFGSNPGNIPLLTIFAQNQNSATSITVNARVDLVYYVCLYDRKLLVQS